MKLNGGAGKVAFVALAKGEVTEEPVPEELHGK